MKYRSHLIAFFLLLPVAALADGDYRADERREWTAVDDGKAKSSNASFDKRLPPVLPGEVVSDGKQKIKVWSTAGSPSVGAERPVTIEPNVSVIVDADRRDREYHHHRNGER